MRDLANGHFGRGIPLTDPRHAFGSGESRSWTTPTNEPPLDSFERIRFARVATSSAAGDFAFCFWRRSS